VRPPLIDTDEWWRRARELAAGAASGDRGAASDLASFVRPWVFRLAARQFPYEGDADDVAQNVSIAVLRSIGNLRDPSRVRSWLAAVTLNEVRGFYRRQRREAVKLEEVSGYRAPDLAAADRTSVLGGYRVDLLDGLSRLPRHEAFALGLRQLGLPYEEIAAEMSLPDRLSTLFDDGRGPVPVGSAKRWVSNARSQLRAST
jgi:RNA polymerase sigma factor (sigma-70 family)